MPGVDGARTVKKQKNVARCSISKRTLGKVCVG